MAESGVPSLPVSKIFVSHVATEIVLLASITYYFYRQNNSLRAQLDELRERIDSYEESNNILTPERSQTYDARIEKLEKTIKSIQVNSSMHLNKLYNLIENLSKGENEELRENALPSMKIGVIEKDEEKKLDEEIDIEIQRSKSTVNQSLKKDLYIDKDGEIVF